MEEDNTGGLYKWTVDALFNRGASPSTKYGKNHDSKYTDTNSVMLDHRKSSSASDLDIFSKYELLPDDEEPDLLRPASVDSTLYQNQDTNTFNRCNKNSFLRMPSIRKTPSFEDPVMSRLFNVQDETKFQSKEGILPGKFPSPEKQAFLHGTSFSRTKAPSGNSGKDQPQKRLDYTSEYVRLMDKLTLNNKAINDLQQEVKTKQMQGVEKEAELQRKYDDIRQELIQELKQSKLIYDNYSKLYHKYKALKSTFSKPIHQEPANFSSGSMQREILLKNRVKQLETQIVDLAIDGERTRKEADEKVLTLELQKQELQNKFDVEKIVYETKIRELEQRLQGQAFPNPQSNSLSSESPSFFSHAHDNSGSTASPYKEYNDTIDTHFLKSLVK